MFEFLQIFLVMFVGGTIPLFIYAMRSVGKNNFTCRGFLFTNRLRMLIGMAILIILSGVLAFVEGVESSFALVGLAPGGTPFVVGFAIGGLLIAAIPGDVK